MLFTIYIKSSISLAVASPILTTNPQCFSETCAPLNVNPLSPQSSINFAAKYPSGLLKVLPALGKFNGCFVVLLLVKSAINAFISS